MAVHLASPPIFDCLYTWRNRTQSEVIDILGLLKDILMRWAVEFLHNIRIMAIAFVRMSTLWKI